MKSECSEEILLPGHHRMVTAYPSSQNSTNFKWILALFGFFAILLTSAIITNELRFHQYEERITLLENEVKEALNQLDELVYLDHTYPPWANWEAEDEEDDDEEDDEGLFKIPIVTLTTSDETKEELQENPTYGAMKFGDDNDGSDESMFKVNLSRRKRQVAIPVLPTYDPSVPRTQDGVPILETSYLDKVGVVPTASYLHFTNPQPQPRTQAQQQSQQQTPDSEGLRLYESLVATGGRGEPKSPDYYPEAQNRGPSDGILPHHRTSAAWPEKKPSLQLRSGDTSGTNFADDVFYKRSGSRSSYTAQQGSATRTGSSAVSGGAGTQSGFASAKATSQFHSSGGSGGSTNYMSGSRTGGNSVINRASRVPATGDYLYSPNTRTRNLGYPPLKKIGTGDGEVIARVLHGDTDSDTETPTPAQRVEAQSKLGDTASAYAEARRLKGTSRNYQRNTRGRQTWSNRGGQARAGGRRLDYGDDGAISDEVNIVKAEAWVEGQKAIAAHYVAHTGNYTTSHPNYLGNGRLVNKNKLFTLWKQSSWMESNDASKANFALSPNGVVTVKQAGLYFIYAQVHYAGKHEIASFKVYVNNEQFVQCTSMATTTHESSSPQKSHTCYTAAINYLRENDRIEIRDVEVNHVSIMYPEKTFFGLMKLNGDSGVPAL